MHGCSLVECVECSTEMMRKCRPMSPMTMAASALLKSITMRKHAARNDGLTDRQAAEFNTMRIIEAGHKLASRTEM
jgi:hypothetical protein